MAQRADIGSKRTIDQTAEAWLRWLLGDRVHHVEASLSTEFQFIGRRSDSLLRIQGPKGPFLGLTEIQMRFDRHMGIRLRSYVALAEEKYHLPVYPVVIYLLPPPAGVEIPTYFHQEFMGIRSHQDFRVIKVWEQDPWLVLEREVATLVPFVPLMKDADERVIRQGVAFIRRQPGLEELESVLAFFASFVLEPEVVTRMMRWDMTILRESPWYEAILQEGRQEGLQEGRQEGLQEGLEKGRRQSLMDILKWRFRTVPEPIQERLNALSLSEIITLTNAALEVQSLEEFEARLTGVEQAHVSGN